MLSSLSVGKVDAYPLVEPQDIANVTSNPFPFIKKPPFQYICTGDISLIQLYCTVTYNILPYPFG